jgi:hypothetical protein
VEPDRKAVTKSAEGIRTSKRTIGVKEPECTRFSCTATVGILKRLKYISSKKKPDSKINCQV